MDNESNVPPKNSKGPLIAVIIIFFVFFIIGMIVIFVIYNNSKKKEDEIEENYLADFLNLKKSSGQNYIQRYDRFEKLSQIKSNNVKISPSVLINSVDKILDNPSNNNVIISSVAIDKVNNNLVKDNLVKDNKCLFISNTSKTKVPLLFPGNNINLPRNSIPYKRLSSTTKYNIFPTNQWFSDLFVENNKNIVQCYPYNMIYQDGFYFDYSKGLNCSGNICDSTTISNTDGDLSYYSTFNKNLHISQIPNSQKILLYYDSMTVIIREYTSCFVYIDYILVKGSPYLTMLYKEVPFELITETIDINSIENITNVQTDDETKNNKVVINNSWVIYFDQPVEIMKINNKIKTKNDYSGVVRIAYLPRLINSTPFGQNEISEGADYESHLSYLDKYYKTYPVGCNIEYFTDRQDKIIKSYVNFNWKTNSNGNPDELAMICLPHHKFTIDRKPGSTYNIKTIKLTDIEYNTGVKGPGRMVIGNVWNLIDAINGQIFDPKNPIRTNHVINTSIGNGNKVLTQWKTDVNNILKKTIYSEDFLIYSQELASLANLLTLAYQLNIKSGNELSLLLNRIQLLLNYMNNNEMVISLSGKTIKNKLIYDEEWGGIVVGISNDPESKYGNNIQLFGNIIYTYTIFKNYKPSFDCSFIETLIRDVANPSSSDKDFPLWRCKDWFSSMSYTGGFNTDNITNIYGRETNKIGQIINCYYSIYCYGFLTNNINLIDVSLTLLLTEMSSFKTYFQSDLNLIDLPSIFNDKSTVNKWQDNKAFLFDDMLENVFSFMLPISTNSLISFRVEWCEKIKPFLEKYIQSGEYSSEKLSYIYNILSIVGNNDDVNDYFNKCYELRLNDESVLSPSLNFIAFHGNSY